MELNYTGYKIKSLTDSELVLIYSNQYDCSEFKENEYLIITDKNEQPIDYFQVCGGRMKHLSYPELKNDFTGSIKPRNPQQYCAFDLLRNKNIPIKLITGKFGSGKSLACIVAALGAIEEGQFDKIIFVRNNVQVKDTDQLGALPGTAYEKTLPYLMPFADHCGGTDGVEQLIYQGKLEVIPLGFLRGRSIKNSILYSMESENLTKEHIQLMMGRVDDGSQLWMDGDIKQRDRGTFDKSRGLETMVERLAGDPMFGYVHLVKSERSPVAALADKLD